MTTSIIGWDVGGANVKAVRILTDGKPNPDPAVVEVPFPLWREPDSLSAVLSGIARQLHGTEDPPRMAVTMTAELADCFANKHEGVVFVLDAFGHAFPRIDPWVYGVDGRFRTIDASRADPLRAAASNWMASATFVAGRFSEGILVDVGGTTSDIIPIVGGRVAARGSTDTERLASGELVYTGAVRTPVSAIVRSVPFAGSPCRIATELFAVAADVHLWLGQIEEGDYTCDTPDGRGRGRREAGARLARMVCADAEMLGEDAITTIAETVFRAQVRQITGGIRQVRRRLGSSAPETAVVAGAGAFLGRAAAAGAALTVRDLAEALGDAAAGAAPAAAVAHLLAASGHV